MARVPDGDEVALRRAVARGVWAWREVAASAVDVIVGPPRVGDDGAGAMARLDRALAVGDARGAAAARTQVERGLVLLVGEATRRRGELDRRAVAQALSDAAYDLGLMALEATPGTPEREEAVRADVAGLLDGITDGARALASWGLPDPSVAAALAEVERRTAALAEKVRGPFDDRARFVVETGSLGVAVRRLAGARRLRVRAPYAPRVPVDGVPPDEQPVSALTVPAPRRAREPLDPETLAARVALGAALFRDRRLSRDGVRACVDCHQPARAFTDGERTPRSLLPSAPIRRNTPTLLYASLSPALFWDGRAITGEGQALAVLHAAAEMGLSDEEVVAALAGDRALVAAFGRAFSREGLTAQTVARALATYEEQALVPASAPIDRFARGEDGALDAAVRRGLDVFVTVGRCARCHVPPSFGGARPPDFSVPVYAVIGAPSSPRGATLDADRGRAAVTGRDVDRGAMRTPALRNVGATAPYLHHGAFPTLDDVLSLYDDGGGRGRGLTVDNQDPDVRPLHLTATQRSDLVALLRRGLADRP